ncbi:hypothetical protein NC651_032157 [Populus alba x Populus x berolinensis]|nr:hypothetical protein NC651_032157 [Populus alba x Populus x berolinensis]
MGALLRTFGLMTLRCSPLLFLDHGTDVFIWLLVTGKDIQEFIADTGRRRTLDCAYRLKPAEPLAEEITELRFPAPRILAFKIFCFSAEYLHTRTHLMNRRQDSRSLRSLTTETTNKATKAALFTLMIQVSAEWMRKSESGAPRNKLICSFT